MHPGKLTKTKENFGGWVLPVEQMDNLRKIPYQYNASAGSVLELLFLQRFWMWLVTWIPTSVAPCVLTCVGLAINVLCCLTVLYYSPDMRAEAPWWTFVLCAVGVFVYQTLDAMDGKQAFKVQNTQIEEVYDHGCDAVSTFFVTISVAVATQLGDSPVYVLAVFLASMVAFYSTHWQDHTTHVMVFGKIDVSEGQFTMMMIHLTTAFYGPGIWRTVVMYSFEIRHILVFLTLLSLFIAIAGNIAIVFGKETPLDSYVKIPRKKHHVWNPAVPLLVLLTCVGVTYSEGLLHYSPLLFILTYGFAFAKLTIKLVMTTVSYGDMDFWDSSLIAPIFLSLNTMLSCTPLLTVPMQSAMICSLVYSIMDCARYFTYASWDLRDALDLWIFSLKYPVGDPRCKNGFNGFYINGINNEELRRSLKKNQKISE